MSYGYGSGAVRNVVALRLTPEELERIDELAKKHNPREWAAPNRSVLMREALMLGLAQIEKRPGPAKKKPTKHTSPTRAPRY